MLRQRYAPRVLPRGRVQPTVTTSAPPARSGWIVASSLPRPASVVLLQSSAPGGAAAPVTTALPTDPSTTVWSTRNRKHENTIAFSSPRFADVILA